MSDLVTTSILAVFITILAAGVGVFLLDKQQGPDRRRRATEIVTGTVKAITQPFVRSRRGKPLAKLILVDSAGVPGLPSMIPLRENGTIKIGRDPDLVGVALNDQRVSRLHCRITDDASGGFRVWDEGSASGTSVNDEDVPMQGTVLRPGDLLAIGPIEYRFEIDISQSDTEPYVRTERRS